MVTDEDDFDIIPDFPLPCVECRELTAVGEGYAGLCDRCAIREFSEAAA